MEAKLTLELDAMEFALLVTAASTGMCATNGEVPHQQYEAIARLFTRQMVLQPDSLNRWNNLMARLRDGAAETFPRLIGDILVVDESPPESTQFPSFPSAGMVS